MGVFLIICAIGCLAGIVFVAQHRDMSYDASASSGIALFVGAMILLGIAAININTVPHG